MEVPRNRHDVDPAPIMLARSELVPPRCNNFLAAAQQNCFGCADMTQPNSTTDGLERRQVAFSAADRPTEFRLNEYPDRPVPAQGRHRSLARKRRPADPFDLFPRSQYAQARRRAGAVQARSARPRGHSNSSAASARTATRSSTSIAPPTRRRRRARRITPAAQWLLDNHYLIEETVFQVKRDLPRRFYRELPVASFGGGQPMPRALAHRLGLCRACRQLGLGLDVRGDRRGLPVGRAAARSANCGRCPRCCASC